MGCQVKIIREKVIAGDHQASLTSAVQAVHRSLLVLPEPEHQSHRVPRDVAGHVTRQRHRAVHHGGDLSHGGVAGLEGGLGGDDHQEREENVVFVDHRVVWCHWFSGSC